MKNNKRSSPSDFVQWITDVFNERDLPEPRRLEAEYLVALALNISRTDIYLQTEKVCSKAEEIAIKKLLEKRLGRQPLSYILGDCEFWTLKLKVGRGTLIPRKETEILVESALKLIPKSPGTPVYILELGTGSAAIPLALATERENLNIFTVEKNENSLRFASENIASRRSKNSGKHNKIHLIQGNAFKAVRRKPIFDLIISNPPYIPEKELQNLMEEVRDWEPEAALNGGKDGMDFFRILKNDSEVLLKAGGFLIFEHGFNQKFLLQKLMDDSCSLRFYDAATDYSNLDRVLVYQKINHPTG